MLALLASTGLYLTASALSACSSSSSPASTASEGGASNHPDAGPGIAPLAGLSQDYLDKFYDGEVAFEAVLGPSDGLGPLYTKTSCVECHSGIGRGPGAATKMVVVGADGITPSDDQSLLPFGNTEHPLLVTQIPGVHTPILPPFVDGGMPDGDGGTVSIRVTTRLGPPLFGRGYMEAIADSEIERMEAQQATRTDGIHGRINRLPFMSQSDPDPTFDSYKPGDTVIGRFGLKARIATLDEFSADALQGDMGITTPMRTSEFANPDGVTDDLKAGVDLTADLMNARGMYARLIDIPPRQRSTQIIQGEAWFSHASQGGCGCDICHQPTLHTRKDYPIPQLADIDAPVYTDMLLHDMGDGLADSVEGTNEGVAGPRDWRTLPLVGLRFCTSYMHDGRAATIEEAINAHSSNGSEANGAVQCFNSLAPSFHQELLDFASSL